MTSIATGAAAMTDKPKRRVRVCQCPNCGWFFKWQRVKKDHEPLQQCLGGCWAVLDALSIRSTELVEPGSLPDYDI